MADEILKRDKNFVTVAAGVTNDASAEVRMLRVDPVTGRVLIDVSGGGGVVTSVNGQTGTVILTTDNVSEGTANKYFTNSRAVTALTGQNISIFTNDSGYLTGSSSGQYKVFYTVGSSNSDYITDGTADNVEIQAAIDAANTAGGGIVYIRKGTYAIASGIALKSKVTVTGEGPTATILTLASGTVIKADTQQYVTLSNLGTNGTSQATNDSSVQVLNSSYVYIEKCNILNANGFGLFINASATNTTSNVWVTKNRITGRGNSDVIGGGPNNSTGAVVSDLYFRDNYVVMDTTISGTYSSAFDIVAVTRVDVQGNHFVGNVTFGFEQFNHRASSISNNNIKPAVGLLAGGVYITANTSETDTDKSLNITGNILDSSEISISAAGSTKKIDGVVITGNTIRPWSTQNGITLNNVTSSIVSGNLVSSGNPAAVFNAAVYLTNSDNITIDGNQFVRCNYGVQDTSNVASVIVGVNGYTSVTTQLKTSGSGLLKYLVASSTAPAATKLIADYVCDGTGDDVEINAALTALPANGGTVELTEGTFNISATVNMKGYQQLIGKGFGTILYAVNSLNSNILQMGANTGTNFGMVLKGMYIDGNQNNQTSGHGVKVVGAYVGIIENVWVRYVYGYGLWLTGVSGQAFSAYNLINECLFSDGYKDGSVGIYCDTMSEFNYFKSSNTDFHTGNQSKGIYINSGNNIFIGGQSDYNGYNLYIAGNVHNKFYGYSFDRATYREVWLTGGTQHNIFTACQFGYYVVIPTLATAITAGATITSLNISAGTPQDIPTYGVPIVVDYGNGSAETFTVSSAGAAAGATTIPVNSKVATSSHSTGAYVVQRYRGVDHQGGSGPNFFTNCIWNGNQSLPTNINWDKQVGEDGGTTSVYEGNIFNGGGGVSLQPNSIFSFTNVLGTLITDNPTYLSVKQGGTGAATLTGLVKGNGTSPFTAAVAGTDYQAPLTFSTGLTNTSSTITSNLSVGVTGGQSVIGGSASGNALTLSSTSNATKGLVIIGTSAYDENANKLGVSTQAPTHSLTLASAGNGAAIYNTTDQTTNFERATMTWGGNIFTLATSKGGTGSNRDMTIQSGGNMRITTNSGQSMFIGNDNNPTVNFLTGSTYTGASGVVNVQGTFTATSGIQKPFVVSPTINNSSAGGYTIFTVNPTVTTVGSGATLLADFQIGGTTQAQITAAGWIAAGGITPTSTLHTGGSFARFVRAITALRTLDASDSIILANGTFTVTLPTAVGITGRIYTIKNSGTGTITVGTTSAQTIYTTAGAVSTQSLTTGMSSDVVSDGTNWQAI